MQGTTSYNTYALQCTRLFYFSSKHANHTHCDAHACAVCLRLEEQTRREGHDILGIASPNAPPSGSKVIPSIAGVTQCECP